MLRILLELITRTYNELTMSDEKLESQEKSLSDILKELETVDELLANRKK